MAFAKTGKPRYAALVEREQRIATLNAEGTADSRKALKAMRDWRPEHDDRKARRAAKAQPGDMFNPTGKKLARGNGHKCDRINSGLRAKAKVPSV